MLLKKLEIRGFKTFADATEMEFTPGITAVVGPNGSGKSNISDAIAWVMGESNVRNLRATRTEDVIFNGSAKRKPVGLAEVSLTLDNSSGRLPIGFSEVTITRRAYRSGDSEYYINKVPCRLRDIFELFLDSGAGRGAYSMVSQGEIDDLLTGKPEDRRELLEEAAGVKKYRHRRHETYRKLEHTRDNLSRVADIMQELQCQMEPLAEQAETAVRHRELTGRLKEIEVGLLVSKVQLLEDDIKAWKDTEVSLTERLMEIGTDLETQTLAEHQAAAVMRESQARLEAAYRDFSEAQSSAERLRSDLAVAQARKRSIEEGRARLGEEITRLETYLAQLLAQGGDSREEIAAVSAEKEEFQIQAADLTTQVDALAAQIAEQESRLTEQEVGVRGLAEDRAAQKSRLDSNTARKAELEQQLESAGERREALEARRAARAAEAAEAAALAASEAQRVTMATNSLESMRTDALQAQENMEEAAAVLEEATRQIHERSSRLKTLREMQDAREGYFGGVKAVMRAAAAGELPPEYAVVADILDLPPHLDQAIEAALGSALQDIVTPSFGFARTAIEMLKSRQLGRATFLPVDNLEKPQLFPADKLCKAKGILGTAYDLVGFEERFEPVARLLLSRVLIAEDIECAQDAARSLTGWSKIVTPDGELLIPSGAITGGSRLKKGSGLMERRRELTELTAELEKLQGEQDAAKTAVVDLKTEQQRLNGAIIEAQREAEAAKVSFAQSEGMRDSARRSLEEIDEALTEMARALESAQTQLEDLNAEITALDAMLSNSSAAEGALEDMLTRQKTEVLRLQSGREVVAGELREASIRKSALEERENALKRALTVLEEDIVRTRSRLEECRAELAQLGENENGDGGSVIELAEAADGASKAFEEAQLHLMSCQAEAQECSKQHQTALDALEDSRETRDKLSEEHHSFQISLTRAEAELAQALERLWDDYEITKNDALTWPEPLLVKHGTVTEVARLRREIRAMGDVNTGSIAEFERVRERWEFLASQRTDLEEARDGLLEAIRQIDESTRDLFLNTFTEVKQNFEEIFVALFGGGVAQLELTKPEDLLETGIDVFVQPPGKTLQNMDLLSGGEKALTAQALLFALMRVRPSPFCVLDEVDAPLDDANVSRFANMLSSYTNESQFIIITHNRATMEAADVLYGITMSEPGISKIVSARLSDD